MARAILCFFSLVSWCVIVYALDALSPLDPSSYSRPELAKVTHISLILNVDFSSKTLYGIVTLDIDVLQEINEMILDVSKLDIQSIEDSFGSPLEYTIDSEVLFGSKLTITLPSRAQSDEKIKLKIKYNTAPDASALQWLEPAQTSGKKYPFLYSQSSPIHARSILPCQDTPGVKFTYDAKVIAPSEFTVLMSALRDPAKENVTTFLQPVPISANLMAIAVGALEFKTIGPRSNLWSEKEEANRSASEFADIEKYLYAAERLLGPYMWAEYDLLVMPPSFPYGGMENPLVTFVTPTLLAGDQSLTDVLLHEIIHSWTGNLVTNRNFEHFWLKEGFTVFLERKVMATLYPNTTEGQKNRDFHSLLGLQELKETIDRLGSTNPLTKLVLDLKGVHPDDAFSTVPYEKGSLFLRYLEDLAGGPEIFDDFIRSFVTNFAEQSIDTDQFKFYFEHYFENNVKLKAVDWNSWLYNTGMPPNDSTQTLNFDTSMIQAVNSLVDNITKNASISPNDVTTFNPHQMIYLLQSLVESPALPIETLHSIGNAYNLVDSKNYEILYRWLRLCIKSRDTNKVNDVFLFLNSQGRMKYVRPIYRDLYAWEDVRKQTIDNFLENEKNMMHVTAYTLRKDLHLVD